MTLVSAVSVTVHVTMPLQAPLQPVNVESELGATSNVTEEPLFSVCEQVDPQSMPAGELVTVPVPVPALVTFRL